MPDLPVPVPGLEPGRLRLRGPALLLDGKRLRMRRSEARVPVGGRETVVRFPKGAWGVMWDPVVLVDGAEVRVAPKFPLPLRLLVFLPPFVFLLAGLSGVVGAFVCLGFNAQLARARMPIVARVLLMLAVIAVAAVLTAGLAISLSTLLGG